MNHSSNQSHFSTVPRAEVPRAKFKRNSNLHTTLDAGNLVPIFVDEVLPADTFMMKEHVFGRLGTPLKPLMDNLYLDTFYFFCPSRLLMTNWQKLMGEQVNPGDSTSYLVPTLPLNNAANQTVYDYMGLPTLVAADININALPLRAYYRIWNAWFRDANLQTALTEQVDDGPDAMADYVLQKRGKRHDYFTSCLPAPQRGAAVTLPLGTSAAVRTADILGNVGVSIIDGNGALKQMNSSAALLTTSATAGTTGGMYADLSTATAATINNIREAFQVQKLYERDMRSGTRYIEILKGHFGVTSPDARLQRPEYLGGSSTRIGISPVANTSSTATEVQGDLAGIGTVSSSDGRFTYSATEHGYIIGLASIRADLNYQEGLNKMWSRSTRFDFYWPALAHLGEQAVLNKEIYAKGVAADALVFGYQERYAEYKYRPNQITGKFRSNDPQSLDLWHLAQDFATLPALNSDFIQEAPPMARVLAVPSEPHMILDCYFDLDCVRPMPLYSVPGLIDHF